MGSCGPNASYSLKDGVLTISGTGEVTTYHDSWPSGVTSVVIKDGITSLSGSNFMHLNITQAEIPDSVIYIGNYAFMGTPWLEGQTEEFFIVGDGILLDYNGSGGEVTVPDAVRSIAGSAFANSDITGITVNDPVEDIGENAFANCARLERVSIADTISHIEGGILNITPWLRAQTEDFIIVGDGVLIAYKGPDGAVEVPDTVRSIAGWALRYYYGNENHREISITEITIPETVTEIASTAMSGGRSVNGAVQDPPVIIHGALGSAAQKFAEEHSLLNLFRFVPFGQEDGSLFNFMKVRFYTPGQFSDVNENDWFCDAVEAAYNIGLMQGNNGVFDPTGNIRLCEAITIAARVRDTYYYEQTNFSTTGIWYQPYVDYVIAHGMLNKAPTDPLRPATRAELASLLAAALPRQALQPINGGVDFPDMDKTHPAFAAAQTMAMAGIMQGRNGFFAPDATLMRCEAAAMLSRCALPELRLH